MVFLSRLQLNLRDRSVRRDLSRPYEMHRTILRAFPNEEEGGPGRVLYRLEEERNTSLPFLLVQSEKEPDWNLLPRGYLAKSDCKSVSEVRFDKGQMLMFRLRANPTKKVKSDKNSKNGRRLGLVKEEDQLNWLHRKGEQGGFRVRGVRVQPGQDMKTYLPNKRVSESEEWHTGTFTDVVFDGVLEITDARKFEQTWQKGVGSAKGFGFGLLSVGRVSSSEKEE